MSLLNADAKKPIPEHSKVNSSVAEANKYVTEVTKHDFVTNNFIKIYTDTYENIYSSIHKSQHSYTHGNVFSHFTAL